MVRALILLCSALLISGCSVTPWVAPYERHYLADPIMGFERDPVAARYMNHVYEARESARGAEGGSGGGCGCN
ncbi:DUF4266 domain-containing protein [Microbulbifer thermotolerans]|uniref:DUF4266 domain-containing protein n=1 Tax=Microbulbifer thermotolerans TaxID=252514 RepID=A0A143HQM3_MICTH|nr:DUF4266 domain-containing protein [Microbulbifer thermotolerans]AMX03720.1 hypothetical protein A3224_15020 [Microbulbifer thermotolerans]MCX2780657.1 DUF4266 domain-containing protein [Microbulbifer thermotolerans]MCX2783617.1 DUF4266 domain-containing protein [Microbulbifer thermotolerans]MCX2795828.1 DUF4266 domain-containing protein [Microbulbifer thermotolerans]MCX2801992.1 DUF4266 domain-containing protein [Microbulbifer thermotolerans]